MNTQLVDQDTLRTQLRGRWLLVARVAWVLLAVLIMVLIAVGIPFEYAYFKSICTGATCPTDPQRLTLEGVQALQALGLSVGFYAAYNVTVEFVGTLVYAIVGAVIFWHRSDDRMGLFAAFTLLTAGCAIFIVSSLEAHAPVLWLPAACVDYLGQVSFLVFFSLFPDGRFVPRWTRWLAVGSTIFWASRIFFPDIPLSVLVGNEMLFVGFLASLIVAQVYRYRRVSTRTQRQQTKWVVYGFVVAIGGFVGAITLHNLILGPQPSGPLDQMIGNAITSGLVLLIPLSIGVAILRSRLWEIDVLIRRTLVYSALTLTLGLVYVGCILVSRTLVAPLTGGSELAIVASTVAIAALFNPLRKRIQNLINKRFYRRKYDAAKVLAAFGTTARDETDLERLTGELLRVVDETMQPEFVGLWLRDPQARSMTEAARPDSRPPA